jgi:hypothetical protein
MPDGNIHFNECNFKLTNDMKNSNYTLLILLLVTFLGSCNKTVEPEQPPVATGTLALHLHAYLDVDANNEVVDTSGAIYTMSNLRRVRPSEIQLYLSNFQLVNADGSTYTIPDSKILQVYNQESYIIGNAPAGNYTSIKFNVGLDPATNQKIPTSSSTDILNNPTMWFGTSAQPEKYVFVNFQGLVDTSTVPNASAALQPFSYKIGTDANYKLVTMPTTTTFAIAPNQTQLLHIYTDFSKLFNGITLNNQANLTMNTPAANATALGVSLSNNLSSMFVFE